MKHVNTYESFLVESIQVELANEIQQLKHYMKAGGERSTDITSTALSLLSKRKQFPKQLIPNKGKVYRGTVMSIDFLKGLGKPDKIEGRYLYYKVPYTSNRMVQSFTYDEKLADRFATANALELRRPNSKPVVIIAEVDDTFVGNYRWLGTIGKEVGLRRNEKEVFHIGKTIDDAVVKVDDLLGFIYPGF